jgi:hypothetical protein
MANWKRNSPGIILNSANIHCIAYLKVGGEREAKTAQSTYWSCHDTIRTQMLNWSEKSGLVMARFWGGTRPKCNVPEFSCGKTVATIRFWFQPVAVRTPVDLVVGQADVAQSRVDSRGVIMVIDRIRNNISRSSSVFWLLTVDCWLHSLFICGILPYLYSCLRGPVHPFFNTITTLLMIALSRSRHAPSDNMPCIPVGYCVHGDEVVNQYCSDNNQAIVRMISCLTKCQIDLELRQLEMRLVSVVRKSANLGR